jgi:hypothetical protein
MRDGLFLTREEAAKKLHCSLYAIDRLIEQGILHKYHLANPVRRPHHRVFVSRAEVNALLHGPPAMAREK